MFIVGHGALLVAHRDLRQNQRFVERFLKLIDHNGLLGDVGNFLVTPGIHQKADGFLHAFYIQAVIIGGKRDDPFFKGGLGQQVSFIIGKRLHIKVQLLGGLAFLFVRLANQPLKLLNVHRGGQSVVPGIGAALAEDYVFGAGNPMGDQNSADAVNQIFQSAGGIVDFVIMPENIDQFVRRNIPVAECNQILQKVP